MAIVVAAMAIPLLSKALTIAPIVIDGVVSDWNAVIGDPQNCVFDSTLNADLDSGTLNGNAEYRDIDKVWWTWDTSATANPNLYFLIKVVDSVKTGTDYIVYVDTNNDGYISSTDKVVSYEFGQNNGTGVQWADYATVYPYGGGSAVATVPVQPDGVSQTWIPPNNRAGAIWDSGNTQKGKAENTATLHAWAGCGQRWVPNGNRTYIECRVRWSDLGVAAGSPIRLKVSSTNPGNSPDDNTGPGTTAFTKLSLTADQQVAAVPSRDVTLTQTLAMSGNTTDVVTLSARTTSGWPVKIVYGGSALTTFTLNGSTAATMAMSATTTTNDTRTVQFVVTLPADAPTGVAQDVYLTATSGRDSTVQSSVHDQIYPGSLVIYPDRASMIATGTTVNYTHYLANSSGTTYTVDLSSTSHGGWPTSLSTSTVVMGPNTTATVSLQTTCPTNALLGSQDVAEIFASPREIPGYTDGAQDVSTVRPRVEVSPDQTATCNAGQLVTFTHTVYNNDDSSQLISLVATSGPSLATSWSVSITADGINTINSITIPAHSSRTVFVSVAIPNDALAGSVNETLTASFGAYSDKATDKIVVNRMATFSDPGFTAPESYFALGDPVFIQASGLTQTTAYFRVTDASGTVVLGASGTASSTAVSDGLTSTRLRTNESSVVGTYTAAVFDGSGTTTASTVQFWVNYRASIADLFASPVATPDETVTIGSLFSNQNSIQILNSRVTYTVWNDANCDGIFNTGDSSISSTGGVFPYAAGATTHDSVLSSVPATGTRSDSWGFTNTNFLVPGQYQVTAVWTTSNGVLIDSKTSQFYSPGGPWPGMSIDKKLGASQPSVVASGDLVDFDIVVTNTGDSVLTTVPLTDTFDTADFAFVSSDCAGGVLTSGTVTWSDITATLGDIAPTQSRTVSVRLRAMRKSDALVNRATSMGSRDTSGVALPSKTDTAGVTADDATTATMTVNQDALLTTSTSVSVDSTVTNVAQMRVDSGAGWSTWDTYNAHLPYTMGAGDGTRTVVAEFKSTYGQVVTCTDTILLDTTAPNTTANVSPSALTSQTIGVTLSASDAVAGVKATYYAVNGGSYATYGAPLSFSAEGTYTVAFYSEDNAGNAETPKSTTVVVDKTAPLFSIVGAGVPTSQTVSLSIDTTETGYTMVATLDGQPFTLPDSVSAEGTHTLVVTLTDAAGNSTTHSVTFVIDKTVPVTVLHDSPSSPTSQTVTVTLEATDDRSGVAHTYYSLDSGAWQEYAGGFDIAAEGSHEIRYYSVDVAGNAETVKTASVLVDKTAPETSALVSPSALSSGTISVTLTTSETLSPPVTTYAAVDGGLYALYVGAIDFADEGTHTVQFFSVDSAGNAESPQSTQVVVDKTGPLFTIESTPASPTSATVTPSISTTETSYVTSATLDGAPFTLGDSFSAEGTHTLVVTLTDDAGNSTTHEVTFVVDKTAPVTTAEASPSAASSQTITVSLTASESVSLPVVIYAAIDGGLYGPYSAGIAFTTDGTHTVDYYAVDAAGNAELPKRITVAIDKTGPDFSIAGIPAQSTSQTVYPSIVTTETNYVVVATLDGIPFTFPDSVSEEGEHHLVVTLFDDAGNWVTHDAYFTIDRTAPVTTPHASESSPASRTIEVTATATDDRSAVAATYYSLDGAPWAEWTGAISIADDGTHTIEYYSVDTVGNVETTRSLTVVEDHTAPITTAHATPAATASQTIEVALTVEESLTAPVTTWVAVDGGEYQLYASPLQFTAEGTYDIQFFSVDSAGNAETPKSMQITVDTTGPDFDLAPAPGTHVDNFWLGIIRHDATDVSYEATIDGAPYVFTDPLPFDEGTHTITVTLFDVLGNSTTRSTWEVVDRTGPITTPHASPSAISSGAISVTLDVVDAYDSTPTTTYYRVDGDATQQTGTGPILFTTEGTHTIDYESFDALGNEEQGGLKHFEVVIDRTGPAFTIEGIPAQATSQTVTPSISTTETSYSTSATLDGAPFTLGDPVSAEGTHTLVVTLTDDAGNSVTHDATFVIDLKAPTTTLHTAPSAPTSHTVSVTLEATDDSSGVAHIYYSLDGASWSEYAGAFDVPAEGAHLVRYFAVDVAGNAESVGQADIVIDATAPETMAHVTPASPASQTITVSLTASESVALPVRTFAAVDGGSYAPYTGPIEFTTEGTHTVQFFSADELGNVETPKSVEVVVDKTGPAFSIEGTPASPTSATVTPSISTTETSYTTSATLDGAPFTLGDSVSAEGTHTLEVTLTDDLGNSTTHEVTFVIDRSAPVTTAHVSPSALSSQTISVTLTTSETLSPPVTTYAAVDGGLYALYVGAIDFADEGTHTVQFFSVDSAGNAESPQSTQVVVDKTGPLFTIESTPASPTSATVTPSISTTETSYTTSATLDGAPFTLGDSVSAEGTHTLAVTLTDDAGNSTTHEVTFVVDKRAPATIMHATPASPASSTVTVTFEVSDNVSGVVATYYSLDGGEWALYLGGFEIAEDATHSVRFYSVDKAGNAESVQESAVVVDSLAPQTTAHVTPASPASQTITVSLTTSESVSLPVFTFVAVDGGTYAPYTGPIEFATDGTHTVQFFSADALGNAETPKSVEVVVDKTGPLFTIEGAPASPTSATVTPSISTTETSYTTSATLDGAPFTLGDSVSAEGTHTLEVTLTDDLGNSTTHEVTFVIDRGEPVTTLHATPASPASSTVTVTLEATDSRSAIAQTLYSLDGGPWVAYAGPFDVASEGSHTVGYYSVDVAGNAEAAKSGEVIVDLQAPVTTAHVTPSALSSATISVSLTATDNLTGVASALVAIDGGVWQPYGGSIDFADEGTHTVQFRSIDVAGNAETPQSVTVTVDKSGPVFSIEGIPSAPTSGTVTPSISTTETSYVTSATLDGEPFTFPGSVSDEGTHTLVVTLIDDAGNSTTHEVTFVIDKTAPVTTAHVAPAALTSQTITVSLTASESVSLTVTTFAAVDGGLYQLYLGQIDFATDGTHTVQFFSVDSAGNAETPKSTEVVVDKTGPAFSIEGIPAETTSHTVTPSIATSETTYTTSAMLDGEPYAMGDPVTTDGTHTIEVTLTDPLGNSTTHSATFVIDATPPVTTAEVWPSALSSGTISVSLTASEAVSRPVARYIALDGGDYEPYVTALHITDEGTHTVRYYSVDAVGNTETAQSVTVVVDKTGPAFTIEGIPGTPTSATVSPSISTTETTITTSAMLDGKPFTFPGDISAEGTHTLTVTLTDELGNETTHSVTFVIDKTAPVTSAHASPSALASATITVTLTAEESTSLPVVTYASADGGTYQLYTGGIDFATEGQHTVDFYSVDAAGNAESPKSATVTIDRTGPSFSIDGIPAQPTSATVAPSIDTTEASFVTSATLDGKPYTFPTDVTEEGTHTLVVTLIDDLGNETTHEVTFVIDKTAPTTTMQTNPASPASSTVAVTLLANADAAVTLYRVDAGEWQVYSGAFDIAAEGTHTVSYYSVDAVGNAESEQSGEVVLDLSAPNSHATGPLTWTSGAATVTISADDTGTGVAYTFYSVDVGLPWLYTMPFEVALEGTHTITYYSVDSLGNIEWPKTLEVYVDSTPPTTSDDAPAGVQNSAPVPVTLAPSDALSGVAYTKYWIESGAETTYTGPIEISEPGTTTIHYYSVDNAGNAETPKSTQVLISTDVPDIIVTGVADGASYGTTVTPGFYSTDPQASLVATLDASSFTSGTPVGEEGSYTLIVTATNTLGLKASVTVHFTIDRTAPVLTVLDVTDGGIYGESVSPDATSSDPSASLEATLDGAPFKLGSEVSAEGSHTLVVSATDPQGNRTTRTIEFLIDLTPPVTHDDAPSDVQSATVPVSLSATDALSGVANTYYAIGESEPATYDGPIQVSAEGTTTIHYWSVDRAGNTETSHAVDIVIDTTAPSGEMAIDEGASRTATVSASVDSTVTDAVTMRVDAGAGFGPWVAYESRIWTELTSGDGTKTVTAEYRDAVGNVLTLTDTIVLDTTGPTITVEGVANGHTYNTAVTPTVSSDDPDASIESLLNGDPFASGTPISLDGTYTIEATATDALGNESTKSVTFYLDRTAPDVVIEGVAEGAVYDHAVAPRVFSHDLGATVSATLNGASFTSSSTISTAGSYTLVGTAEDAAGNVASTTVHFQIQLSAGATPTIIAAAAQPSGILVTWDAAPAENLSGYRVYRATSAEGPFSQIGTATPEETSCLDTSAASDVTYYYRITAIYGEIETAPSNVVSASLSFTAERVSGKDRYDTAVDAVDAVFKRAPVVIIATGRTYPDALAASSLAGHYRAPLMLVKVNSVPARVKSELKKLRTRKVIVLGDEHAVGKADVKVFKGMGLTVQRIGGKNRYETALAIAQTVAKLEGRSASKTLYIARGDAFQDALSIAPAAYRTKSPVLLSYRSALYSKAAYSLLKSYRKVVIIGGTVSIQQQVEDKVRTVVADTTRVGGNDFYETSYLVAGWQIDQGLVTGNRLYLTTGETFPDAMFGGVVAGEANAVMALTTPASLHSRAEQLLSERKGWIRDLRVLGGTNAVSDATLARARQVLSGL